MVKPVCPDDFSEEEMPEFIVETLNKMIKENWDKGKRCAEIRFSKFTDELAGQSYKFEWSENQMETWNSFTLLKAGSFRKMPCGVIGLFPNIKNFPLSLCGFDPKLPHKPRRAPVRRAKLC